MATIKAEDNRVFKEFADKELENECMTAIVEDRIKLRAEEKKAKQKKKDDIVMTEEFVYYALTGCRM